MGRPRSTPEQTERRRLRRAWETRTTVKALRLLRRRHHAEFLAIREEVRQDDPEPGKGRS